MTVKFMLQPDPTFKANVNIPRPGQDDGIITFTFRHKTLEDISDLEKQEDMTSKAFLLEIIADWALPDEFNVENLGVLFSNYPQSMRAITEKYYAEMLGAREKN